MVRSRLLALLLCALAGCATSKPLPDIDTSTTGNPVIDELLRREIADLKPQAFTAEDGALQGEILTAEQARQETEGEVTVVATPIGTESEIVCRLFPKRIDAAASFGKVVKTAGKNVQIRAARMTDVEVVDGRAVMFFVAEYLTEAPDKKTKLYGQVKAGVLPGTRRSILCLHDEVGYRETFRRVVKGLAGSLQEREPMPAPTFVEIHVQRFRGIVIGVDEQRLYRRADGAGVREGLTVTFGYKGGDEVIAHDILTVERFDARGEVEEIVQAQAAGPKLETSVRLVRLRAKTYRYAGTFKGEPVEGKFDVDAELLAYAAQVPIVRAKMLGEGARELRLRSYVPIVDPKGPSEVVYRREGEAPGAVVVEAPGARLTGQLDEMGLLERFEIQVPVGPVKSERVFLQGAP